MKICAMVWHLKGRGIDNFRFDTDGKKNGLDLDRLLGTLDELKLNRYLARIDAGNMPDSLSSINQDNQKITAFGIGFSIVEDRTLVNDLT